LDPVTIWLIQLDSETWFNWKWFELAGIKLLKTTINWYKW
jgi:hypothetical protein